jgi:thioredoxin-like negative regulator of GroEL
LTPADLDATVGADSKGDDMAKSCPLKARSLSGMQAKELLEKRDGKVRLVQFHMPHCGACHEVNPEVDKVAREVCGATDVCRVNVDTVVGDKIAEELGINDLPTVAVVQDGKILQHIEGAGEGSTAPDFLKLLKKYLED